MDIRDIKICSMEIGDGYQERCIRLSKDSFQVSRSSWVESDIIHKPFVKRLTGNDR